MYLFQKNESFTIIGYDALCDYFKGLFCTIKKYKKYLLFPLFLTVEMTIHTQTRVPESQPGPRNLLYCEYKHDTTHV